MEACYTYLSYVYIPISCSNKLLLTTTENTTSSLRSSFQNSMSMERTKLPTTEYRPSSTISSSNTYLTSTSPSPQYSTPVPDYMTKWTSQSTGTSIMLQSTIVTMTSAIVS